MSKKRVEWAVRLKPSNYNRNKGELIPQVVLTQTYTLEDVINRIVAKGSGIHIETLRHAASLLTGEIEECLIEGSSVNTPLGIFTPAVTGSWGQDRIQPEERKQNTATVQYSLSKQLKEALSDPLFHETGGTGFRLSIYSVHDHATHTENQAITPGRAFTLRGRMLLMNGDLPQRGLYLVHADTGKVECHIRPEDLALNTRGKIIAQWPAGLPAGKYLVRVVSQCTTSPAPLKEARECTTETPLLVTT